MFSWIVSAIILGTLISQLDNTNSVRPTVEMRVLNEQPVVGEPLVVNFIARNDTRTDICTPPPGYINGGLVEFVLYAHRGAERVGSSVSSTFCGSRHGVMQIDGHCREEETLRDGAQLSGHGFAVLLNSPASSVFSTPEAPPLGPGRYTVRAHVIWGKWGLETNGVQIEIVPPVTSDDIRASQLVDRVFAVFMSPQPTMGLDRALNPARSVKAILDQCPDSVHARLARPRLLVLQADRLEWPSVTTDEEREAVRQQRLDVVTRIDEHLRTNPDDPLALDLMDGKVQLLWRLEDEKGLRKAIDALIARYPESGRARRAEATWRQLHSNPGDTE